MNIILHIGQAKTGTSSIQKTFRSAHQACLNAGVLYPIDANYREQHHLLELGLTPRTDMRFTQNALMPGPLSKRVFDRRDLQLFTQRLKETLQRHRPDTLVLSSEMLFRNFSETGVQQGATRDWLQLIAPHAAIRVVAYIRSPQSWFMTNAQQLYKQNFQMPRSRFYSNIKQTVSYYTREFPGQVDLHSYDQLATQPGGTLSHFIAHYTPAVQHLNLEQAGHSQQNQRIDTETLSQLYAAYARVNEWASGPFRRYLFWMACEFVNTQKQPRSTALRLRDTAAVIDSAWLSEYRWLAENHGIYFKDDPWLQMLDQGEPSQSKLSSNPRAAEIFALDTALMETTRQALIGGMIKAIPGLLNHCLSLERTGLHLRRKRWMASILEQ